MAKNYGCIDVNGIVFEYRVVPAFRCASLSEGGVETDAIVYLIMTRTTNVRTGASSEWMEGASYVTAGDARRHLQHIVGSGG